MSAAPRTSVPQTWQSVIQFRFPFSLGSINQVKQFDTSANRRDTAATAVRQRPLPSRRGLALHPLDQTDFAPLLGLTIWHSVRSVSNRYKKPFQLSFPS